MTSHLRVEIKANKRAGHITEPVAWEAPCKRRCSGVQEGCALAQEGCALAQEGCALAQEGVLGTWVPINLSDISVLDYSKEALSKRYFRIAQTCFLCKRKFGTEINLDQHHCWF
jgi:hypothetical protein